MTMFYTEPLRALTTAVRAALEVLTALVEQSRQQNKPGVRRTIPIHSSVHTAVARELLEAADQCAARIQVAEAVYFGTTMARKNLAQVDDITARGAETAAELVIRQAARDIRDLDLPPIDLSRYTNLLQLLERFGLVSKQPRRRMFARPAPRVAPRIAPPLIPGHDDDHYYCVPVIARPSSAIKPPPPAPKFGRASRLTVGNSPATVRSTSSAAPSPAGRLF